MHWGAGRECRYSGASMGIGGIRGLLECRAVRRLSGGVGVRVYWVLVGSVGTEGPVGYRWNQGTPRGVRGHQQIGGVRNALDAGRECR